MPKPSESQPNTYLHQGFPVSIRTCSELYASKIDRILGIMSPQKISEVPQWSALPLAITTQLSLILRGKLKKLEGVYDQLLTVLKDENTSLGFLQEKCDINADIAEVVYAIIRKHVYPSDPPRFRR